MKTLCAAFILSLLMLPINVAQAKHVYADIQVTHVVPTDNFIWQRVNQNTPKYPIELARDGVKGCALLSFDINESGKTKNVELIRSVPKKRLGKQAKKMLKKWKWQPVDSQVTKSVQRRVIRLDFCLGSESSEQSQQYCKRQAQLSCESQ